MPALALKPGVQVIPQEIPVRDVQAELQNTLNAIVGQPLNNGTLSNVRYTLDAYRQMFVQSGTTGTTITGRSFISTHTGEGHQWYGDMVEAPTGSIFTVNTQTVTNLLQTHSTAGFFDSGTSTGSSFNINITDPGTISITGGDVYLSFSDFKMSEEQIQQSRHFAARNFMRDKLRSKGVIRTGVRYGLNEGVSAQELKARSTLRDLLTEKDWRRYVTNGFIMVKGGSGRWYQIFNNSSSHVKVYKDGKLTHSLCVHTVKDCPPTDHVINMMTLVAIDENEIFARANVSDYTRNDGLTVNGNICFGNASAAPESLVDYFKKLKQIHVREGQAVYTVGDSAALVLAC